MNGKFPRGKTSAERLHHSGLFGIKFRGQTRHHFASGPVIGIGDALHGTRFLSD